MKKYFLFLITLCLFLTSCHKKQVVADKPDNLINRKTMVEILMDCYLAEAMVYVSLDSISAQEGEQLTISLYKEIFDRYHVTKQQFLTSIEYYISDKEAIEKIMEEVTTNLYQKKINSNIPDSLLRRPLESIMRPTTTTDDTSKNKAEQTAPGTDL